MPQDKLSKLLSNAPSSEEFTRSLGQVTWLMTLSKPHRSLEVGSIESRICAPLMFKQLRVFMKEKQPLAALTWAYASDDVVRRLESGDTQMKLQDWRSGPNITVVECISPFADPNIFINAFLKEAEATQARQPR